MDVFLEYTDVDKQTRLVNKYTREGQDITTVLQLRHEKKDWEPETWSASEALWALIQNTRAQVVVQHGGLGKSGTKRLGWLVNQELDRRWEAQQNLELEAMLGDEPRSIVKAKALEPASDGIVYLMAGMYDAMDPQET
jgi:hypothetical protein